MEINHLLSWNAFQFMFYRMIEQNVVHLSELMLGSSVILLTVALCLLASFVATYNEYISILVLWDNLVQSAVQLI